MPEIWLYDGKEPYIYHLKEGRYLKAKRSSAFPVLSASYLTSLLECLETNEQHLIIRDLRIYLRENYNKK